MFVRAAVVLLSVGLLGACAPTLVATPGSVRAEAPCHARGRALFALPDPRCTPGATDPRVTQADIARTICVRGYTRHVRPPERVSEPQKLASMAAYGDRGSPRRYEYDHLIPLELGGASDDRRDLWPEPGASPNPKDRLERVLRRAVCRGQLPLMAAQRELARNWVAADESALSRDAHLTRTVSEHGARV